MKKQIFIIVFLIYNLASFSQNYWFKKIENPNYQHPVGDILIKNGEYYFTVVESYSSQTYNGEYYSVLYKIDNQDEIQNSGIIRSDYKNLLGTMNQLDNGDILALGHIYMPEEDDVFALWQLVFDDYLNIIKQKIDTSNIGKGYVMNSFRTSSDEIVFHQVIASNSYNRDFKGTYLARISSDNTILKDTIIDIPSFDIAPNFISEQSFLIFTFHLDEAEDLHWNQINLLNYSFQLQSTPISFDGSRLSWFFSIHNSADLHYYCNAFHFSGNGNWVDSSAANKLDTNFNELHYQVFDTANFWFHAPNHNGIDTYEDRVYVGGNFGYFGQEQYYSNFVSLVIMDTSLNILEQRFYGGDGNYMLNSIKTTDEGDVLLLGHCSDVGPNVWNAFIMKVDKDGLITSTEDDLQISIKNAIVLPNPGKDYLELHTGKYPAKLQLFDMGGHQVIEEQVSQGKTIINTQKIKPGSYIWRLIQKGRIVETGKWVRQ